MTTNTETMSVISLYLTKGLLLASGLLASGIAATILFVPEAFYAAYEIDIDSNVNLANELKAPAGLLLVAGLLMLTGVVRSKFAALSLSTATVIYLSYGLSRVFSMATDGFPNSGLVSAAAIEIAIGVACLIGFARLRRVTSGV